jgi:hypothetical protein
MFMLDHECLDISRACLESIERAGGLQYVAVEDVARRVHRALARDAWAMIQRMLEAGSLGYEPREGERILSIRARLAEEFPP